MRITPKTLMLNSLWSFGVFLDYPEPAEFGLEAVDGVSAGWSAGESGGEHHSVVRQHRDGNPVVSDGSPERREHGRPGHWLVAGDA
jgi:hypothetical protein